MSEAAERPPHAVLIRSPAGFSAHALAAVLAKRRGVPALDLELSCRRGWGVAAESLPAAEAESLAAELEAAGQAALAAPSSLLEPVPAPEPIKKAALAGGALDAGGERLAWTRLAAACAAALETRTVAPGPSSPAQAAERALRLGLSIVVGLPLMKGKKEPAPIEKKDRRWVLDLLFLEPSRRLRVDAREFDYSLLGARMSYSAELNFAMLLAELAARAPGALHGRGTRALLAHRPAAESLYEDLDDLAREERWLLSLAALKAAL